MRSAKNWIIVALAGALALSAAAGVHARAHGGVNVEIIVWQNVDEPGQHYISARLAGGSWRTHGTVSLELDDGRHGAWRYGEHSVELEVVATCSSGIAVPNPAENRELVADCEELLRVEDTLDHYFTSYSDNGYRTEPLLNWSAEIPMRRWTGVTVGGAPRRVTTLDLSNLELSGELSPRLGNLTGLIELRLEDASLRGPIPSRLALLLNLTHVYLGGNPSLTGCAPSSLSGVPHNDVGTLGLAECGPPTDVTDTDYPPRLLTEGTYRWGSTVFDIPPGRELWIMLNLAEDAGADLLLQTQRYDFDDPDSEWPDTLWLFEGVEVRRSTSDALFDRVVESLWEGGWPLP